MFLSSFTRLTKSLKRNDAGNISVMTAVMAGVLVAGLAVAIDVSTGVNEKSRLGDASDAVSLMLAKSDLTSEAEMKRAAQTYLDKLYPGTHGARLEILAIVKEGDAVTVKLANVADANFGTAQNRHDIRTSVASTAVYSRKSMDIALVLDSTGSMSGSKMTTLKRAATDMIETVDGYSTSNVRFSVVPFSNYVNVGMGVRGQSWLNVQADRPGQTWQGCVGSRLAPHNTRVRHNGRPVPALYSHQVTCGTEVQPLTTDFTAVKSSINSLNASGWTYMPSGLIWGWRTLDAGTPFASASPAGVEKVLVLMTDGQNTRAKNGILHDQAGQNAKADETTRELCNAIKDEDVTVYTIAYDVSNVPTRQLLQGCASENANYYDARNAADLNQAFSDIANALNQLRISS